MTPFPVSKKKSSPAKRLSRKIETHIVLTPIQIERWISDSEKPFAPAYFSVRQSLGSIFRKKYWIKKSVFVEISLQSKSENATNLLTIG